MRCTYYLPFEDKEGNALYRAHNGQRLNMVGNPVMRRQNIVGSALGRGLEFGESSTNLISNSMYDSVAIGDFSWLANTTYRSIPGGIFGRNCVRCDIPSGAAPGVSTTGFALKYASWLANTQHSASLYYKIVSDGGSVWRGYVTGNQGFGTQVLIADGKWHRFVSTNVKNGTTGSEGIRIYNYGNTLTSDATILFDGYQQEVGIHPTPFNSNGKTTRSSQFLRIPTKGVIPSKSGGSFYIVFKPDWASNMTWASNPTFMSIWSASDEYWNLGYSHTTDKFRFVTRNSTSWSYVESPVVSFSRGDPIMLVGVWNGSKADLYANGVASGTGELTQYSMSWPKEIILGANYDYGNQPNGVFEEFAIFNEPMTSIMVDRIYNNVVLKGLKLQDAGMI